MGGLQWLEIRNMSDPENGWKDPHEAMPMVMDAEGMKWAMAFMTGQKPELDRDGWMYMLHGDMGEDNTKQLVFNKDAADGQWIVSGPHLMLMPKDPSSLKGLTTDFNSGDPYIMFEGTGYDHVMIPIEGYYKYNQKVRTLSRFQKPLNYSLMEGNFILTINYIVRLNTQ